MIKTAVLLFATITIFFQDLVLILSDAVLSETTSYILAVPFMLGYLIYRKRKMIRASASLEPLKLVRNVSLNVVVGTLLVLASFLLYWYGSYTFSPLEYHLLALPIFASGCVLILFNTQMLRQLAFPIVFMFLLVPPPAEFFFNVGALLSTISSTLAFYLVTLFGFPARLGAEYGTPIIYVTQASGNTLSFAVDIACSGIYSQVGFFVFTLFMVYLVRDRLWKKGGFFLIGFPLIYLLNVVRIFTIVVVGYYYGLDLALNIFHLLGGWLLIFIGMLLLLLVSEKFLHLRIISHQTENCTECTTSPETKRSFCYSCGRILKTTVHKLDLGDITKIAGLLTCVVLIMSIQAPVFALTEGPAEIILQNPQGQQVTTDILPPTPDYTLQFVYRDLEFEKIAKQDASLMYAYMPNDGTKKVIWVAIEVATAISSLHRWEVCLVTYPISAGYQPEISQIEKKDVELLQNPPIISRYFVFNWHDSNLTEAVLYWYETSIFQLNTTTTQKNVKISVITYPFETESVEQTETELLTFGTAIANYWQPIKTWSYTALLISQRGSYLLVIIAATLILLFVFRRVNQNRINQTNLTAYQKLSTENKAIIDAVHHTTTTRTPLNIATTYQKRNKKAIATPELVKQLQKATDAGLISQHLTNVQDEPAVGWRVNFSPK